MSRSEAIEEQIELSMGFHPGSAETAPLYGALRLRFRELAHHINNICPSGRYKSLAITHLEDALMRAIQSIAVEQPLGPETRYEQRLQNLPPEYSSSDEAG